MDKAHASRISYGRSQCESQCEHTRDAVPRYTASYGSPQCESQCEYASDEVRSSQSSYRSYKTVCTLPHPSITSVPSKHHVINESIGLPCRKYNSFYKAPAFMRRAGLTARSESLENEQFCILTSFPTLNNSQDPSQQRHQNDDPHRAALQPNFSPYKHKTRRGNRNIIVGLNRYKHWNEIRAENRRNWRVIKSSSSEVVRKLIAASPLGDAIQEANLLRANHKDETQASSQLSFSREKHSDPRNAKKLLRHGKKQHGCLIQTWKIQRKITIQRKVERDTRRRIKRRIKASSSNHGLSESHSKHNSQNSQSPNGNSQSPNRTTATKLSYAEKITVASLNCRGLVETGNREQIIQVMQEHRIDIMAIQETKISTSSEETKIQEKTGDKFKFVFSSNAQDQHPRPVQVNRPGRIANTKSQAKAKAANRITEHHGVGFVIDPKLVDHVKDCIPHNSRFIELLLANHGPDICLVNHHAPHSGRSLEENMQHWDMLQDIVNARGKHLPTFILGDTNARLHGSTSQVEDQVMGRYTFGYGSQHVPDLPEEQRDNRQFLIDFCITNEYAIMNTFFPKPDHKKCTYKDVTTDGFKSPWTPDRFAQIDFVLAPNTFRNSITDVESRPDIAINSDHAIVTAAVRLKLKAQALRKKDPVIRYFPTTSGQQVTYNERIRIRNLFSLEHGQDEGLSNCERFAMAMKSAANQSFLRRHTVIAKPYLSDET